MCLSYPSLSHWDLEAWYMVNVNVSGLIIVITVKPQVAVIEFM